MRILIYEKKNCLRFLQCLDEILSYFFLHSFVCKASSNILKLVAQFTKENAREYILVRSYCK